MTTLNANELDIIKKQLHVPSLNEIKDGNSQYRNLIINWQKNPIA